MNFSNNKTHEKLTKLLNTFKLFKKNTTNKLILKHIEGLIIGTTLVALYMENHIKIDANNKLTISNQVSPKNKSFIMKLFKYSSEQILKTEIGWCEPWIFTYDKKGSLVDFKILAIGGKSNSNVPFIPNFNK